MWVEGCGKCWNVSKTFLENMFSNKYKSFKREKKTALFCQVLLICFVVTSVWSHDVGVGWATGPALRGGSENCVEG
jgi:hypothetical protein